MADLAALPSRPVPIGAFPLPFGYLLLPAAGTPEVAEIAAGLLAGRLPAQWPASLSGYESALACDIEAALAAFAGDDPVNRYNRFVLDPDTVDADRLRDDLGEPLGVLVDLVRHATAQQDDPPAMDGLDGELAALAFAAHAASALASDEPESAVPFLRLAIAASEPVYRPLAGLLYGALGQAQRQVGDFEAAAEALESGLRLLDDTDLDVGRAELHVELAGVYHELAGEQPALQARAIHHYHCALQAINETQAPEVWAAAHSNLAALYLTMPMIEASDQLRLGVAVGSLRAALNVYQPDTYPREWASTQLNLANALVYAPSTHQADNLVEAVELYEAVLQRRSRDDDPLAYARVLANQGNVLAHLGMFDHARGKLVEARYVFEEFHEYEATTAVRGVLDEIARQTTLASAEAG